MPYVIPPLKIKHRKKLYLKSKNQVKHQRNTKKQKGNMLNQKTFFICSYGGCGSKMLITFLKKYGNVVHIHDRVPPRNLCMVQRKSDNDATFTHQLISNNSLNKAFVIYIFRDPTEAQVSRWNLNHFTHIQVPNLQQNSTIISTPTEYIKNNQNLLKYDEFHNNYTTPNQRNYRIYAINYHKLFVPGNILKLCQILKLPKNACATFPRKRETSAKKWEEYRNGLDLLNESLKMKIQLSPFLQII
jgi:hypothetical protein